MAKLRYLLDLPVLAELTRPAGNRRVFTLFQQQQSACAIGAPASYALLRGVAGMRDGERREQLQAFTAELLLTGPPVLPFDHDAAIWLARADVDQARTRRNWTVLDAQLAAIAASRELVLVTRGAASFAGLADLRVEDWFRP
ncbi:type II toxin-antitoxin system VapC family toxin [Solimonas terrae]|uniref:Type II toxin-antitoxin system VapC family toxin n=1 Tax=Solimonas terrae TaxID=1396819 RepID=A0A6M2BVB1_9GAMM|nr:type II toxin-antitoxin system VapC family toxin [Solimonas terrae]NGY06506.1 type II toxin-antitoxin system VapC family toxin [Solimonas terrae]